MRTFVLLAHTRLITLNLHPVLVDLHGHVTDDMTQSMPIHARDTLLISCRANVLFKVWRQIQCNHDGYCHRTWCLCKFSAINLHKAKWTITYNIQHHSSFMRAWFKFSITVTSFYCFQDGGSLVVLCWFQVKLFLSEFIIFLGCKKFMSYHCYFIAS